VLFGVVCSQNQICGGEADVTGRHGIFETEIPIRVLTVIWARSIAASAANWGHLKRSRPWPTNWQSFSTGCCASDKNTSTGGEQFYEEKYRQQQISLLHRKVAQLRIFARFARL
jgi:hypothetical protein